MSATRPAADRERARRTAELRRSGAAGIHPDRRTARRRTRGDDKRADLAERRKDW